MTASLSDMLQDMVDQLPGCLHTSVIDGNTGLSLVSVSDEVDALDAAGTDAYHNDLYRLSKSTLEGSPLTDEVSEVIMTSRQARFVSVPVGDSGYLWLVVTRRDATVGFIQAMMRKHVEKIGEGLSALVD